MSSRALQVKVCDVAGGGQGERALALCDKNGHPLPGQVSVDTRAAIGEAAFVTVTFLIDGAMVCWA